MSRWLPYFLLVACCLIAAQSVAAHDLTLTRTVLILLPDGTWRADVLCDLDALALGAPPSSDSEELVAALHALPTDELERLQERLVDQLGRRVRMRFDDEIAPLQISLPDLSEDFAVRLSAGGQPTIFGLRARFSGELPPEAEFFTFRASRALPPVHLTVVDRRAGHADDDSALDARFELLQRGVPSSPYDLSMPPEPPSATQTAGRYVVLGFIHILPAGIDHILFVLGLFLLQAAWRPLLIQVSAFTVAHTLTLGLATMDLIRLSPDIVEPLIAASICWIAVENLFTDELARSRVALIFAFGLLHGLGFAGVLGELGLPTGRRLIALLSFNVGVELGQIAVLAAAFLLLGPWLRKSWYRRRIVVPSSLAIALVGLYWTVERIGWIG